MIARFLNRKGRKITVHELQQLCGFLNFLGRCIIPGRAFTRRIYALNNGLSKKLKQHHDLEMWRIFLSHHSAFACPFLDVTDIVKATEIDMYLDATGNFSLSFGAICQNSWMFSQWNTAFLEKYQPSIQYLELFAVIAGVKAWIHRFRNQQILLCCNNNSVVGMINSMSSKCKHCMVLIRLLVLKSLKENVRVFAKHLTTKENKISDLLSRLDIKEFRRITKNEYEDTPTKIPMELWQMEKVWLS